jgi:hypothetical protein
MRGHHRNDPSTVVDDVEGRKQPRQADDHRHCDRREEERQRPVVGSKYVRTGWREDAPRRPDGEQTESPDVEHRHERRHLAVGHHCVEDERKHHVRPSSALQCESDEQQSQR